MVRRSVCAECIIVLSGNNRPMNVVGLLHCSMNVRSEESHRPRYSYPDAAMQARRYGRFLFLWESYTATHTPQNNSAYNNTQYSLHAQVCDTTHVLTMFVLLVYLYNIHVPRNHCEYVSVFFSSLIVCTHGQYADVSLLCTVQ